VDPDRARALAMEAHRGQTDRSGGRLADHVARVAAAVPAEARAVAWLHEMLERSDASAESLRVAGLSAEEVAAVELLTRDGRESYETHALGLAFAAGAAGHLARVVKLADLDDHLAHVAPGLDAPPYAWARRHIAMIEG
jgi:(p)ppGpp synthase/HD superfamily hydrolase